MRDFFSLKQVEATPGHVVRAFRTNFKLTLKDIQSLTGISTTNLSAMENDKRPIGIQSAILLAAAFGIGPEQILFPSGYERPEDRKAAEIRAKASKLLAQKAKEERHASVKHAS